MSELEIKVAKIRAKLTNVKKVFLVYGERGEYEDHYTWEVCAFDTEAAADEYARLLNEFYNEEVYPHQHRTRSDEYRTACDYMQRLDDMFRDYTDSDPDNRPRYAVQPIDVSCAVNADEAERLAMVHTAAMTQS